MSNITLSKRLLALDESAFIELLESGSLYKLYPELKGELFNVGQFTLAKEQYETKIKAEQGAYEFLSSICSFSGSDPSDIYELMEEHSEAIILMLEAQELDLDTIFDAIREEQ